MSDNHRSLSMIWVEDQMEEFILGAEAPLREELLGLGYQLDDSQLYKAKTVDYAERVMDQCQKTGYGPDVVLLDLMLPQDDEDLKAKRVDLDGGYLIWFEIRKMQKWSNLATVPILIITARGRPEYRDQVGDDPATRWLAKPANPSQVARCIADLVAQAGAK